MVLARLPPPTFVAPLIALTLLPACAPRSAAPPSLPLHSALPSTDGTLEPLVPSAEAAFTVLEFTSPHCACQRAHEGRLRALAAAYAPHGVRVFLVDSEAGAPASPGRDADARAYGLAVLQDAGAKIADAVGAEFATYSVVIDRTGIVRYRGGIDSDRNDLTPAATPYLADALDNLLAGREPRRKKTEALGCSLQKW